MVRSGRGWGGKLQRDLGYYTKKSMIYLGLFSVKIQPQALVVAPYYVFEWRFFCCAALQACECCMCIFLSLCMYTFTCVFVYVGMTKRREA